MKPRTDPTLQTILVGILYAMPFWIVIAAVVMLIWR